MKLRVRWVFAALVVLWFSLLSGAVRADQVSFDDAALAAHPRMLIATTVSATQTSVTFTAQSMMAGWFTLNVSACTTCNLTFKVLAVDSSGIAQDWSLLSDPAAITTTGAFHFFLGPGASTASGGASVRAVAAYRLPDLFKVQVVHNSGTSESFTVTGIGWRH